jgi:ubiquinone/menaquinone biosynthesis C-methylase UbiE
METGHKNENQGEAIISLFDQGLRWWQDVYREDLPRGFFSFEMRRRLELVTNQLTAQIRNMDNPDVLECGCGPGDILELLAPLRCKLTGLDLNPRYLNLAAKRVPGATLIDGNVEQLPFPDTSFDIVYAVGVFQYLKDERAAARELCRVTKEGGVVLVSFANYRMLHLFLDPYYLYRIIKKFSGFNKQPANTGVEEAPIRRYPLAQLRNLFREYGLHEIQTTSTSYGPLKFWRKEFLPLATSMRSSEILRNWSDTKRLSVLKHGGNHLILTLRKGAVPTGTASVNRGSL